ncbi:GntR family transcriptional regulator [Pelobacter seleniigenes]|uniref:GntR family transcriptional regulator n=1 Tax=Pelobacter seleniigenes TaxID=407188 RepID=UPI00068E8731|nr:GntR family transcriptional regulator [Pelobacter seleniigenes]
MKALKRTQSLTERAYATLRKAIINADFMLGEPLSETLLAASLGISKSPVREALAQLKAEGLVTIIPQKGTFVFTLTPKELIDLIQMRYILESAALRLAFERCHAELVGRLRQTLQAMQRHLEHDEQDLYLQLDAVFHDVPFELCANDYLRDAHQRQIAGKQAALRLRSARQPKHTEKTFAHHRRLVELLEQGGLEEALQLLAAHFSTSEKFYIDNLNKMAVSTASSTRKARLLKEG